MSPYVFKAMPADAWRTAQETGVFQAFPEDVADGFVHLSAPDQIAETLRLRFAGREHIVVIGFDAARLGPALRWEPSRGGALFPHLYGALPLGAVVFAAPAPLGADGAPILPEGAPQ